MNIKRDLEFLYEVGSFRFLQRTWKQFLNPDFQNISEHTLRVLWISLILAKYEGVKNCEKLLKMALVHDLSESRSGDVNYLSRQYCERMEDMAINDIFKNTILENEFIKLWQEYEKKKSLEAKIIKDADNLDVDLELCEQEARGHKLKKIWLKNRQRAVYEKLYTTSAKKFWKEIIKSSPHDWHLNARNRFNNGDWKK
ncbi:MAG: HD domain-containing protein [Patescibacteria group bacterium]